MNRQTANNLFIHSSMPRLYQRLLTGIADYHELGKRVLREVKVAHAFRKIERVEELSKILLDTPIKEYRLIAQYYLIWCQHRKTNYHAEALERIIEQTQTYKTKALFSRGAIEWYKRNSESALSFYTEALKTSPSVSDYIELVRSFAVLKSTEGFHKSALGDLESIMPLLKYAEPRLYYDFLNSYAVELGEVGRKTEARNICKVVHASHYAFAYPEWRETAEKLRPVNRSFIVIDSSPARMGKLLSMPPVGQGKVSALKRPAQVINLSQWKKKMGKDDKPLSELDDREMLLKIVELATTKGLPDEALLEMTQALEKIITKYTENKEKE